jgi:hypothetical protein
MKLTGSRLRSSGCVAVAATFAALAASAVPAGAAPAPATVKTGGNITAIAADGARVAVAISATSTTCDRVAIWQPKAHKVTRFNASTNCPHGERVLGEGIVEVALAGSKAAWVEELLGNHQYLTLKARTIGQAKAKVLADAENFNGAEGDVDGDYVGNVLGDGSLLAYNTWTICTAYPVGFEVDGPKCQEPAPGDQPVEVVKNPALWRAGNAKPRATGPTAYELGAVDAGRVVTRQGNTLTVFDSNGKLITTVALGPGDVSGIALSGQDLVVLQAGKLDVYSASTGALTGTVDASSYTHARLTDVDHGVAVVVADEGVFPVRLDGSGPNVSLVAPATAVVDAQIESGGVWVAYNLGGGKYPGRVAFFAGI